MRTEPSGLPGSIPGGGVLIMGKDYECKKEEKQPLVVDLREYKLAYGITHAIYSYGEPIPIDELK